jgi:hypothetical protein
MTGGGSDECIVAVSLSLSLSLYRSDSNIAVGVDGARKLDSFGGER